MSNVIRDLRFSARALLRAPAFAATAVLILGLGIGLSATVFTIYRALLLRRLPVRDQERTVVLWGELPGRFPNVGIAYPAYLELRSSSRALRDAAAFVHYRIPTVLLRDGDRTIPIRPSYVTGNLFRVLGAKPFVGRLLLPSDDALGAVPALVLSYTAWRREFGADRGIVGRSLMVAGTNIRVPVVGVAPPGLNLPLGVDGWVAILAAAPNAPTDSLGRGLPLNVVGQLAPGATLAQARDEFSLALHASRAGPPDMIRLLVADAHRLNDVIVGNVRPAVIAVGIAVVLLMLIACANVGNLLLVRAAGRQHEFAVRRALGAGFIELTRLLWGESVILGLLGGTVGAILALAFVHSFIALAPADLPRVEEIAPGAGVLMIAAAVAAVSTLLFGLMPALWSVGADIASPMRATARGDSSKRSQFTRSALVSWQVALAIVVLSAAGLIVRSLEHLEHLDLGFSPSGLAIADLEWPWSGYGSLTTARELMTRIVDRIEATPGVVAASPVYQLPFSGSEGANHDIVAEGQPGTDSRSTIFAGVELAGPDYFRTFGLPLLRGRAFTSADREGSLPVIIVSEDVAKRLWPGVDPIGKRLHLNAPSERTHWLTVVGVAPETRYHGFASAGPSIYYPYNQYPNLSTLIAVRTSGDPRALLPTLREALKETNPQLRIWRFDSMDELLSAPLAQPRLNGLLFSTFAFAALILAAIGLYAIMATSVRQQTREFGVRIALGATPGMISRLVLLRALMIVTTGLAIGLAAALIGSRVLRSLLYEVSPTDPVTLGVVSVVLICAALLAAYVPARRAMRLDPVQALKAE